MSSQFWLGLIVGWGVGGIASCILIVALIAMNNHTGE
jgi:hypothetical protein